MQTTRDAMDDELHTLRDENRRLRARLEKLESQKRKERERKLGWLKGGGSLLLPLLDRQKVVRSFARLLDTVSLYSGPTHGWPTRDEVLEDTKAFLESCVRFMIRRRTVLLLLSLLAAAVPAIQIWLVIQQNRIIDNQNEFFEIQVYDVVARSMTEGDRNARQVTGALLAHGSLEFLEGVVEEVFDPGLSGIYRAEGVDAADRRLEDAAFRGHVVRALARGIELRGREGEPDSDTLNEQTAPMFRQVVRDAADRVPLVMRLGRQAESIDPALAEQVDHYLAQIGELLRVQWMLSRAVEQEARYFDSIAPLFARISRTEASGRFAAAHRSALQELLVDLALEPTFEEPHVSLPEGPEAADQALSQGLERLRRGIGSSRGVDFDSIARQARVPR